MSKRTILIIIIAILILAIAGVGIWFYQNKIRSQAIGLGIDAPCTLTVKVEAPSNITFPTNTPAPKICVSYIGKVDDPDPAYQWVPMQFTTNAWEASITNISCRSDVEYDVQAGLIVNNNSDPYILRGKKLHRHMPWQNMQLTMPVETVKINGLNAPVNGTFATSTMQSNEGGGFRVVKDFSSQSFCYNPDKLDIKVSPTTSNFTFRLPLGNYNPNNFFNSWIMIGDNVFPSQVSPLQAEYTLSVASTGTNAFKMVYDEIKKIITIKAPSTVPTSTTSSKVTSTTTNGSTTASSILTTTTTTTRRK